MLVLSDAPNERNTMQIPEPCYHWQVREAPLVGFRCEACGDTFYERPTFASAVRRARIWRAMTAPVEVTP